MDCSLYLSALVEVEYCVGIWSVSAKKRSVPISKRGIALDGDQGVAGLLQVLTIRLDDHASLV